MDIKKEVEAEIHKIHRSRNRIGYFPNSLALGISLFFQEKLFEGHLWLVSLILVILGTGIRITVGEILFGYWAQKVKWARLLSLAGFVCLGLGWGIHFLDVLQKYGPESSNVTYTLLIIIAFITAASTSLIGDKASYYTYALTLTCSVGISYLLEPDFAHAFIILNIILYLSFSIGHFRVAYRQLLEQVEAKLISLQEKERLSNIIDTVPGYVALIDRNFYCYMANKDALNLYPNLLDNKIGAIDPNSEWEKTVIDFINSSKNNFIGPEESVKDGKEIHALLNLRKMKDGGAILISIITTELVLAERKLREQEAKTQYAAKLASLGEVAAGIAHEVNNPLAIIHGSANIVRRLVDEEPMDKENVKLLSTKMIETSIRISKIIKSLKALSRNGENDSKEIVDLNKILNESMEVAGPRAKLLGISLKKTDGPIVLKIMGREVQISQVIINLINNAFDAVKDLEEKWVEISIKEEENFINIYVIDSGKGVPPEIQRRIMEPFFTTKDVNQGTGLGLSISKNIMADHNGELTLLPDEPNTTFRLRLPLLHDS